MTKPLIQLDDLHMSFGPQTILQGFSLDIHQGETITIIGGSGSGKSVTLKIILGLLIPDSGRALYEGDDVTHMSEQRLHDMRKEVSMLFQSGALFDSLNVRENIAYPLREHFNHSEAELSDIIANRLEMVGLPGIEQKMPSELSGGMRKRVALARAIATEPKVILYDEPTTGLDPANTKRISLLIRQLQEQLNVTSVVVTHDMGSAFIVADRMAMLYNRKVEFVGSVDEARCSSNRVVKGFIEGSYDAI